MVDYARFYSKLALSVKASEIRELLAVISRKKEVISFAGGIPDPSLFPREDLAEIARDIIVKYGDVALQYGETRGVIEVRDTLCKFLKKTKNIACDPEGNMVITTGSQSALDLVARALIDPDDLVVTENPTYLAAIGAFKNAGAKFIGIPLDEEGMKTDYLEKKLEEIPSEERKKVKFIYTIPIAQNPAGVSMNRERKKHLLEIASRFDLLIVEDDPYGYLVFEEGADRATLKSMDSEGRVVYMSTVSKILAPGLRIGWVVADENIARKIELIKQYTDLHSPSLNQFIVAEAIKRGVIERVIARALPHYKAKRDTMLKAMGEYFPEYTWYSKPVGGLFVFTYVYKKGFDAGLLLRRAIEEYKVAYVPGKSFHVHGGGENSLRINFSYPTHEQINEGIRRLARLIEESGP